MLGRTPIVAILATLSAAVMAQDAPRLLVRFAEEPVAASASRPAAAPIPVLLQWRAATGQLRRRCGGLEADDDQQLRRLVVAAHPVAKGRAPLVVELDAEAGVSAEALMHTAQVLAGVAEVRFAQAPTATVSLAPPGFQAERLSEVEVYHDPGRAACAPLTCGERSHWVLAIRGKRYEIGTRAFLERVQFEAEQQRKPGGERRVLAFRPQAGTPQEFLIGLLVACTRSMPLVELVPSTGPAPESRPR